MADTNFIWADLSSYDTAKSIDFYSKVFNWNIEDQKEYHIGKREGVYQAGIFEMPDFLKKIKMPHFWMSYFHVASTESITVLAKTLDAKIEVENIPFNKGNISLLRDPQGAGFTIYDGRELFFGSEQHHGSFIATELQVSDVSKVLTFYSQIFNWEYEEVGQNTYQVNSQNSTIKIRELSNEIKGKHEYWVTTIQVDNLEATTKQIIKNGGTLISKEVDRNVLADNSGEAFFYITEV